MNLYEKCNEVLKLFDELERRINQYTTRTGLACPSDCRGECCNREDIYATTLEFLPLSFFLHRENLLDHFFSRSSIRDSGVCLLFSKDEGRCLFYEYRGLVCRLFGFASIRDKNGLPVMVTCKIIKSLYREIVRKDPSPIIMADYHRRLSLIDIRLGTGLLHINRAILDAIELAGLYLKYN